MQTVFEVPAWPLSVLLDWIAGDDAEDLTLADLVADLLPTPTDDELLCHPWLRSAWQTPGVPKTAAYLRCAQLNEWHDADPDDFDVLEVWAHRYAIALRRCLIHPAEPDEIADALATLGDVLGQDIPAITAAFIIETIGKARLPAFPVNALCHRVALIETGKVKPAPFARLIEPMRKRLKQARLAADDAAVFERHVAKALPFLRDQLAGEQSAASPMPRRVAQ